MSKNTALLGLCVFMALVSTGFAAPTGDHSFDFGLPGKPVWDISGHYDLTPTVGEETTVQIPIAITQDSQGMLSGALDGTVLIDGVPVSGTCTLKGKVTNSGGVGRINATIKLAGSGVIDDQQTAYTLSANYKLEIDPSTRTVVGTARGSAKADKLGSGPVADDISEELPADMNGSWRLNMNLIPTANKLGGTSSVVLAGGRTLNMGVKGTYSAKTGNSNISLTGADSSKGATLKVMGTGDELTPLTVKGKILGQVVQ